MFVYQFASTIFNVNDDTFERYTIFKSRVTPFFIPELNSLLKYFSPFDASNLSPYLNVTSFNQVNFRVITIRVPYD